MFDIKTIFLTLAASLLFATPAASFTWDDCAGNTAGELYTIARYNLTCIAVANADSTNTTRIFFVRAKTARLCFDPALDSEGADTGQITVRECPNGQKPAANPENECDLVTVALTGLGGEDGTQFRCRTLSTGSYFVDVTTAMGAGNTGRVTIQGEGD